VGIISCLSPARWIESLPAGNDGVAADKADTMILYAGTFSE